MMYTYFVSFAREEEYGNIVVSAFGNIVVNSEFNADNDLLRFSRETTTKIIEEYDVSGVCILYYHRIIPE